MTESKAHVDARVAFTAKHGTCAIEAGFTCNLADHECPHGNLPSTAKPNCSCFPRKGKR